LIVTTPTSMLVSLDTEADYMSHS